MSQPVLPGTLEMLALKAISLGPAHGFAVMQRIQRGSGDVLQVEQGALYPALHRLEAQDLIAAEWGISENNRRAKFYRLTTAGRRRLRSDQESWFELSEAINALLRSGAELRA
ncbi:MAG: PadR family transcriptional regulator [Xanthomonadales bacterium]|nr:PadR family transcriptional regulator [Xanthomonadales bacterium]